MKILEKGVVSVIIRHVRDVRKKMKIHEKGVVEV
jgi:hypothetical protein